MRDTRTPRRWLRRAGVLASLGGVACVLLVLLCHLHVENVASQRLATSAEGLQPHDIALVFGTSATLSNGRRNLFFEYRLDAAAELYRLGRVRKILVSGDNGRKGYNEPADMRAGLVARGVPGRDVILDHAGFRTLDSVVRLREVFGQQRAILVSQRFHLERALFLAEAHRVAAVGYAARCPRLRWHHRARELLARVAAVFDCYILGTPPRFLGPKEPMGLASERSVRPAP